MPVPRATAWFTQGYIYIAIPYATACASGGAVLLEVSRSSVMTLGTTGRRAGHPPPKRSSWTGKRCSRATQRSAALRGQSTGPAGSHRPTELPCPIPCHSRS